VRSPMLPDYKAFDTFAFTLIDRPLGLIQDADRTAFVIARLPSLQVALTIRSPFAAFRAAGGFSSACFVWYKRDRIVRVIIFFGCCSRE